MDKDCNCAIFQYGTCINCGKPAFTGNPTKTNGEGQIDRIPALLAEIEEMKRENKALKVLREERPNLQVALRKAEARADALLTEIEILRTKNKAFAGANDHLKEELDALLSENEELKRERDKLINKLNTDSQNFEIECLKARAEAAESREKDLAAKLEIVSVAASALAFCAETSGGTAGRDEDLCRAIEGVKSILSLPIPGSAQHRDEEVRREERERCAKIAEDLVIPGMAGQLASTRAFQFQIAEAIRAACEKGGEG